LRLNRLKRRALRFTAGLLLVFSLGGCGVELAVLGAAASAASQGSAVYKRGKLQASWMGQFDMVVAAGEAAGSDLGLLMRSTNGDVAEGEWETVFYTYDGKRIEIRTTRRTPQLIEFQIDVGWFGSESTARLLLKRMAVAINLDANRDGSGEVLLPTVLPPAPEPEPPSDPEPAREEHDSAPNLNDPDDDEAPASHRGGEMR
jgi:hypothetical protein